MADPAPPPGARTAFDLPPFLPNAPAAGRRVGVEIEFTGLSAHTAARALRAALGGRLIEHDPHAFRIQDSRLGDLRVELDTRYVHPQAHDGTLPLRLGPRTAAWMGSALRGVVPRELITAPVPVHRLADIDRAVAVLREAGAKGRGRTWFGSLGLHFNVDLPRLDAETLTAALKAFILLEPWLRQAGSGSGGGRPSFVAAATYPAAYVRRVLAPDYWPSLPALAADYLAANPTRKRGLDLLPVLLHLDEARVRARLPYAKIGRRPVLHYRLPLARVGVPDWSILPDWHRWLAVERLAADPARLGALGRAYLAFAGTEQAWTRQLTRTAAFSPC